MSGPRGPFRRGYWLLLTLLGLVLAGGPASAHTNSTGLARLEFQGTEAHYRLTLSPTEVGDAAILVQRGGAGDVDAAQQVMAVLQKHLTLSVDDKRCRVKRSRIQAPKLGTDQVTLLLDWQCTNAPGMLVLQDTLSTAFGEHYRSIASISRSADPEAQIASGADGEDGAVSRRQEHILDREHPQVRIDFGQAARSSLGGFLRLGLDHILSGFDHLLFLAALLLGSRSLRSLLITVTAFTAAHSLSLAAATLGWLHVAGTWVEPAIAASIVWVAVENIWLQPHPLRRHALTFGFGLVHGLAFAEALTELHLSGWPLARALLGFNVGVETGQALVVLLLAPALTWLARHPVGPHIARALSLGIASMGLVWVVQRLAQS
ncbi:HupE/UreJ family protein [Rhodoferax sp.]|uniref:HupE/UreJ family protein n=1 Tax=Rhodoferax sp. TaxID=50421 RepID=UPI002606338E|nr:HupE/UreJ family protein [Rhodoferax sp.]MDD2919128.1 HupE/UreJ family protein [Rhodoferax sp.]